MSERVSEPVTVTLGTPLTAGDAYRYQRRPTHVVMVGDVGVGGTLPIRVQSMTTTLTADITATVAQTLRLVDAGCEIVRVTTPSTQDARALGEIKRRLRAEGVRVPLVADIHFNPASAMEAANYADKVRINPGNYADKKTFAVREYTDQEYALELERIADRFRPLVERCRQRGVSMRIGVNHGSLSDRIMNRYGDTPTGMVESALEFVRLCEDAGYRDVIFSMKASNPKVMVQAYRLLAARLDAGGRTYPLHLGVTEAGGGADGRIKSAIGIGALLEDGLGDTIRVSLTEEPEAEIPVALALARRYTPGAGGLAATSAVYPVALPAVAPLPDHRDPYHFQPRPVAECRIGPAPFGGRWPARVVMDLPDRPGGLADPAAAARQMVLPVGMAGLRPDIVVAVVGDAADLAALPAVLHGLGDDPAAPGLLADISAAPELATRVAMLAGALRVCESVGDEDSVFAAALAGARAASVPLWVEVKQPGNVDELRALAARHAYPAVDQALARAAAVLAADGPGLVLAIAAADRSYLVWAARLLDSRLRAHGSGVPIHLRATAGGPSDEALLECAIGLGAPLIDGIGQSVQIEGDVPRARRLRLAYDILQGAGARATKTEFIACPSCGRTLFDLQATTARIQARMSHLVGVKIAVMGCVVNGLGELADADFGYMGSGVGKVNLFVGRECVARNLPAEEADERLVDLIKAHGRWFDPPAAATGSSGG